MAKAKWDTDAAYEMYLAGKSDKQIGEELNVDPAAIGNYRRKHWETPLSVVPVETEAPEDLKSAESPVELPKPDFDPWDIYSVMETATRELKGIQAICTANAIQNLWNWDSKEALLKARADIDYLLKKLGEENATR